MQALEEVEEAIRAACANESTGTLRIVRSWHNPRPILTVIDAQRITECIQDNPRFRKLNIRNYRLCNHDALRIFRDRLPLCDTVTTVTLFGSHMGNEGLEILLPAFYNTSITKLSLYDNKIQGQRGGEAIAGLLVGNNTLMRWLDLMANPIGPEGAFGLGRGLSRNHRLQQLTLGDCKLGNEGLENLILSMGDIKNHSLTYLAIGNNDIVGAEGVLLVSLLLQCFPRLNVLDINSNLIGPDGARALAQCISAEASLLGRLYMKDCNFGNEGLANLILSMGDIKNRLLTFLAMGDNYIQGAEGGRLVSLLLQCLPNLNELDISSNRIGPLGAHALAEGISAEASRLERLDLTGCEVGNDGVALLVPEGQVNRTLTTLDLRGWNNIQGLDGGENVIALASRCTNIDNLRVWDNVLNADQRRRLDLLSDRKRLYAKALALAGSPFSALFRFLEQEAHSHKHGLNAIFIILQNDGDDYFCNANNRAMK